MNFLNLSSPYPFELQQLPMFAVVGILSCLTLPSVQLLSPSVRNELSKEYMTGGELLPNAHLCHVSSLLLARTTVPVYCPGSLEGKLPSECQ